MERNTSTFSALFLVTVGGMLALLGPFFLIYCTGDLTSLQGYSFIDRGFTGLQEIPSFVGDYSLGWAISVCGILALAFASIASSLHRRSVAAFVPVFGLISLVVPILLAMRLSDFMGSTLIGVFFTSNPGFILIYLGGLMAIIGGFLVFAGGLLLVIRIHTYVKQKRADELAYQKKLREEEARRSDLSDQAVRAKLVRNFMATATTEKDGEPTDAEMEALLSSMISLDVPSYIDIGATEQLTAIVSNKTDDTLDKIKMDLSDLEPYFDIVGDMRFVNIRPSAEVKGTVKITPKRGEGTYPVIIEISQGEIHIEKKFLITVRGSDAY